MRACINFTEQMHYFYHGNQRYFMKTSKNMITTQTKYRRATPKGKMIYYGLPPFDMYTQNLLDIIQTYTAQ